MTLETFAYVLGAILGIVFLLGIIFSTKKLPEESICVEYKSQRKALFMIVLCFLMFGFSFSIMSLLKEPGLNWINQILAMAYWLSMIFIFIYVQNRNLVATAVGVGYRDLFGRVGKLYFPWDQIERFEITTTQIVFFTKSGVQLKMKIALSESDLKAEKDKVRKLFKQK